MCLPIGILASFIGAVWAQYERSNPAYWATWGLSRNAANLIKILTTIIFPGGYLLVLFAPGHGWLFNIGMLALTHFVVVTVFAGLTAGIVGGLAGRRRALR
jgi:hypothetical protein